MEFWNVQFKILKQDFEIHGIIKKLMILGVDFVVTI
jgi:hypothetical protein